jgi:hypothetical protein
MPNFDGDSGGGDLILMETWEVIALHANDSQPRAGDSMFG